MNSLAWLMPFIVMFSPSATVLLNTRRPLCASVSPSLRLRGLSNAAVRNTIRFSSGVRLTDTGIGEPGADDEVDVLGGEPVDHPDHVLDPVLTVGVERGEHRRAGPAAGVLDAGLDGRALAEVDRMAHDVRARAQRDVAGVVAAAVIDTDHVVENGANVGDDVADDAGLVEGGDDDPNVVVTRVDGPQTTR